MKQLKLDVSLREETGSNANNRLRKAGRIPAVVYGKSGSKSLSVDEKDFRMMMRAIAGAAALVKVADDQGNSILSVIKSIQRNPCTDRLIHIDFHEISPNEEMHATLSVRVEGECYGVKNERGFLSIPIHTVEVRCLPKDLPEFITVDVTELKAGESIHISQLTKIQGVTFQGDPEIVVVACASPTKVAEANDADEGEEAAPAA